MAHCVLRDRCSISAIGILLAFSMNYEQQAGPNLQSNVALRSSAIVKKWTPTNNA